MTEARGLVTSGESLVLSVSSSGNRGVGLGSLVRRGCPTLASRGGASPLSPQHPQVLWGDKGPCGLATANGQKRWLVAAPASCCSRKLPAGGPGLSHPLRGQASGPLCPQFTDPGFLPGLPHCSWPWPVLVAGVTSPCWFASVSSSALEGRDQGSRLGLWAPHTVAPHSLPLHSNLLRPVRSGPVGVWGGALGGSWEPRLRTWLQSQQS